MSLQSPTICTRCGDLSENPDGWRSNATRVLVEELKYSSPGVGGRHPPSIVDLSTLAALESADFDITCKRPAPTQAVNTEGSQISQDYMLRRLSLFKNTGGGTPMKPFTNG